MGKKKRINRVNQPAEAVKESTVQPEAAAGYSYKKSLFLLLAVLAITAAVYSGSINNGFVNWDDDVNVYENPNIREISPHTLKIFFTEPLIKMYTPLTYFSFALDYQFAGLNPHMYHFTNLLLHILNVCLVFLIVRLLSDNYWIAAAVSLLFSIHPVNVAAVAPVSIRSSLLSSVFYLSAFWLYLRYLQNSINIKYLIGVFALFIFALLSKSSAVVLPLLMLLADYFFGRRFNKKTIIEKIPFLCLSVIFGVLTIVFRDDTGVTGSQFVFNWLERLFMVSYALVLYMYKLILPLNLSAFYPYPDNSSGFLPIEYYFSPLILAAMVTGIYKLKKYRKELVFGAGFFLIHIVLVLRVVPFGEEMVCDRYAYLPSIGFFLTAAAVYYKWISELKSSWNLKKISVVALLVVSLCFSFISYNRIKIWKDSITLYDDILSRYNAAVIYSNRGLERHELQDYTGAIADFNKAIEMNPNHAYPYNNRGFSKSRLKDYDDALADFNKAIELNPSYHNAYINRGNLKKEGNDYQGAAADYSRAIELKPEYANAYNNRGFAKYQMQDYSGAMSDYNKAIELDSYSAEAYYNRAHLRLQQQDIAGAIYDFDMVIKLKPVAMAYINRGNAKMVQKNYNGAIADYNEALKLRPNASGILANRGWGRLLSNDAAGACADWRAAYELERREGLMQVLRQYCK